MLPDNIVLLKIGNHLKSARLRQDITQASLAEAAGISLSSLKKIEGGRIGSFDSLLRVMRILGKLDVLQPLVDEEQISPNEYYQLVHSAGAGRLRQRAAGRIKDKDKEEAEW